jgi:hypothetical protein
MAVAYLIEHRGASIGITDSAGVEKGNKKKILTGTSVPLDLPANGRPGSVSDPELSGAANLRR